MTTRSDLPRLGASLGLLGTLIEMRGQEAHDITRGWEQGPIQIARPGPRGGGGVDGDEDRRHEAMQRVRASKVHQQIRDLHSELEQVVQRGLKLYDVAFPGHPAEVRNKRTGDLDPITPADVAADGWCASCWRNDQQMVAREKSKKSGLYYSSMYCRWCQGVKATYGIEPPLEMLKLHHAGRRISEQAMREAVDDVVAKQPKAKGKKGKKSKKGKAA